VIEPGSQGVIQARVTKTEDGQSLEMFNDFSPKEQATQWKEKADSTYLKGFNSLDKVGIKFDVAFTSSLILPTDSLLLYKGVGFLNQVPSNSKNLRAPISYHSFLKGGKPGIPVGASADNAVVFGASYTQ